MIASTASVFAIIVIFINLGAMAGETNEADRKIVSNNNAKWIKFPYEIHDVDEVTNRKLLQDFTGERTGFVQVGPKKWFFPSGYRRNAELYYNFQPRADDVWIVTFPRSGTTWTQELIWLVSNDLDYDRAKAKPLEERFPFLEFNSFVHPLVKAEFLRENPQNASIIEEICSSILPQLNETTEKRFIKTHLPFELLPPNLLEIGCKVVYVARNPKDVAVSFYHLNKLFRTQGYLGDFPTYWNYFEKNLQPWTPYWSHIEQGWDKRNNKNVLFLFYEDMNKDLKGAVRRMTNFLGKNYTDEQLATLEDHLKIENFRNNPSVNGDILKQLGITVKSEEGFVRKGQNGGASQYFTKEMSERADKWVQKHLMMAQIEFPTIEN